MARLLGRFAALAALTYLGLCAYLYVAQDSLLYFPTPETASDIADPLWLENDGESLKIWTVGDGSDALLYFGGNGENVVHNVARFHRQFPDTRLYLMNYRGYGGSSGEPDEQAFYRDAALLFDHAAAAHERVSVIGRSLGSGVAAWLAAHRPVHRLVLVTPYDSVESVAQAAYPVAPVSLLLRDRYPSIDVAMDIAAPTLIVQAEEDRIIPAAHTERLAQRLAERDGGAALARITLAGTNHNSIARSPGYVPAIQSFLRTGQVAPSAISAQ